MLGIDVSHHNGKIDWTQVAPNAAFVFIKATQGARFKDPMFQQNWDGAQAAGIPVGAYHFLDPAVDGDEQAERFLSVLPSGSPALPPVLDVETLAGSSSGAVMNAVVAWLKHVQKALNRTAVLYTSASFWNSLGNPGTCQELPLWTAHYGVQTPRIPPCWQKWTFWQFTQTGSCPGVPGNVDKNQFSGSVYDLQMLIG